MVLRSIEERYNEALNAFHSGDLNIAEDLLTEIVNEAEDFNSNYFLAVVKSQLGKYEEAIKYYQNTISKAPNHPEAYFNMALCQQKLERQDEALESYLKAVEINPHLDDAYNNIAYIYQEKGDLENAEKFLLKTSDNFFSKSGNESSLGEIEHPELIPEIADAVKLIKLGKLDKAKSLLKENKYKYQDNKQFLMAYGNICFHLPDYEEALSSFESALELDPDDATIYYSIAVCLQRLDKKEECFAYYKKSIELNPDYPDALNNLALIYFNKKEYEKAEEYFNRALQADPEHLNSLVNFGSTKTFLNDYEAASAAFDLATDIAKKRNDTENLSIIYTNIGFLELRKDNLELALDYFNKSLELNPEYVIGNYNKGETLLKLGNFEEGWKFYEYRIRRDEFGPRKFHNMLQNREQIKDNRILVYGEQGLGDALHFLRYLKLVKNDGGYVIFECDKGLHPLLKNASYIDELVERQSIEKRTDIEYDYDIPLLSLAKIYNTDLNNIPLEIPYVHADKEKIDYWKQYIGDEGFKVGLVWGGSPVHQNDKNRSIKLAQLSFLFGIPNVKFYSLQKGIPQIQLSDYKLMVNDLDEIGIKSWADTAAIIENLDLVLTVDTSVCHLAGAMGKDVWVMLPYNSDWRWLLKREDSPWYPSMKLYRQHELGDWSKVFERIEKDLKNAASGENEPEEAEYIEIKNEETLNSDPVGSNSGEEKYELEIPESLNEDISLSVAQQIFGNLQIEKASNAIIWGGFENRMIEEMAKFSENVTVFAATGSEKDYYSGNSPLSEDYASLPQADIIWSRYHLNQVQNPNEELSKIVAKLSTNGLAYLEIPAENTQLHHESSKGNYSIFGQKMWNSLIERNNLEIIAQDTIEIDLEDGRKDKNYYFLVKPKGKTTKTPEKEVQNDLPTLTLSLPKGENFGWGVCSKYIRKELDGKIKVINTPGNIKEYKKVDGKVFHALQNHNFEPMEKIWGDENYGYTFFEFELNQNSVENAKKFDKVFGGSTWNEEKMNEKGIKNTGVLIQGIDPERFYPGEKEKNNELFIIFSGGKFELRKGQDIVLKAFKILHKKYPDMILMNAWYNLWPHTMETMKISPHIKYNMEGETWKNKMISLLQANEIDGERVFTLPVVPNEKLRDVYLNTDIGLFPNRCEGGTNLVLMEYMACGKPVVASYNTGHKDILTKENSLLLEKMSPLELKDESGNVIANWYEPDLDEVIAQIEFAYQNRDKIKSLGKTAGKDMKNFTWQKTAENLISSLY